MEHIYTNITASISEFKKSPSALIEAAGGMPIALLKNNKPEAYVVPVHLYEKMLEQLDDMELLRIAISRSGQDEEFVPVDLDRL